MRWRGKGNYCAGIRKKIIYTSHWGIWITGIVEMERKYLTNNITNYYFLQKNWEGRDGIKQNWNFIQEYTLYNSSPSPHDLFIVNNDSESSSFIGFLCHKPGSSWGGRAVWVGSTKRMKFECKKKLNRYWRTFF